MRYDPVSSTRYFVLNRKIHFFLQLPPTTSMIFCALQSPLVSFCLKTTYFLVSNSSIFVISMKDQIVSLAVDVRCSMKYTCGKTCLKGEYIGMELPGLV